MLALSPDIGDAHIGYGVDRDKEWEASSSLLPSVVAELRKILNICGAAKEECDGISTGLPGLVDARKGHILSTLKNTKTLFIWNFRNGPCVTSD